MGSALWAGVSGLNASSKELDVIGNNLANVNTVGFKAGSTFFADVLSESVSGGSSGTMQVGRGVAVADVETQFATGSFETTGNATDAAIDGDGFFLVNDNNNATYYTRAGSFHLNADGLLVDTNGYKVQGQAITNGVITGAIADIDLHNVQSAPQVTTTFAIAANLDSSTVTGGQYNSTQTVYDSLGNEHTLSNTFTKTAHSGVGYWAVQSALDATNATTQTANGFIFDGDGNMTGMYTGTVGAVTASALGTATAVLDRPGMVYQTGALTLTRGATAGAWTITGPGGYTNATITSANASTVDISLDGTGTTDLHLNLGGTWASTDTAQFTITNTASALADVTVSFPGALPGGATIGTGGNLNWNLVGVGSLTSTQYASPSVIKSLTSDGYASGQLTSLSISSAGRVSGLFTNGQTADLSQIELASFVDPWGLKSMGNNLFAETAASGAPLINAPGNSGLGTLTPNTLEMSNTDIANEFVNMITAQKAYQANARVITTQDTLMQTLMNIQS